MSDPDFPRAVGEIDLSRIPPTNRAILERIAEMRGITLAETVRVLVIEETDRLLRSVVNPHHSPPSTQGIIEGARSARLAGEPNYLPPRERHLADPDGRAARRKRALLGSPSGAFCRAGNSESPGGNLSES